MVTSKDSTYKCSLSGGYTILGIMTDRCVQIMNLNNLAKKSMSLDNKISHCYIVLGILYHLINKSTHLYVYRVPYNPDCLEVFYRMPEFPLRASVSVKEKLLFLLFWDVFIMIIFSI